MVSPANMELSAQLSPYQPDADLPEHSLAPFHSFGDSNESLRQEAVAKYLSCCENRGVEADGGVVICLQLGLVEICPSKSLSNMELLALVDVLPFTQEWVERLALSRQPIGNTGAALLFHEALPKNTHIKELDLRMASITASGAITLAEALHKSNLHHLSLAGNTLCGPRSAKKVADALRHAVQRTETLHTLDLSKCGLTERSMRTIQKAHKSRTQQQFCACSMDFSGNFLVIEVLNSISHGVGVIVAIICFAILPSQMSLHPWTAKASVYVYLASLLWMFFNSTLYHSLYYAINTHYVFQALDHAGIYILIAGSYTPVLVIGCPCANTALIVVVVIFYWVTAIVGVSLVTLAEWPKPRWYEIASLAIYIIMGVGGAPMLGVSGCELARCYAAVIGGGGACFLLGVPFFVQSVARPTFHIIWHVFVLAGCMVLLASVWMLAKFSDGTCHRNLACPNY